jgi:hypothetical protein
MIKLSPAGIGLTRRCLAGAWTVSRWLWPLAAILAIVIAAVIAQFTPITASIWENASQWLRWYLFVFGIVFTTGYFPLAVAHGMTRRDVLAVFGLSALAVSVVWAMLMTAGLVIERAAYAWLGWTYTLRGPHLFDGGYDVGGMLAEYGLIFLSYLVSGSLIAAAYYRFGSWRGTLLLPLTLLPLVGIEAVLSTGWVGAIEDSFSSARPAVLVAVVTSIGLVVLTALANYLLLRDVPIHSKTS